MKAVFKDFPFGKNWKATFVLFAWAIFCLPTLAPAQTMALEVIGNVGKVATTASGSLHYTAGECAVTEQSNGNLLSQGFHQIMVYKLTPIEEPEMVSFEVKTFPNPTVDWLNVQSEQPVQLTLYSLLGQTLQTTSAQTLHQLNLSDYAAGIYLLQLTDEEGRILKTVRVQKAE